MSELSTDPWFDSASQEVRTAGERIYAVDDVPNVVNAGAEGVYVGKHAMYGIVVDWDTPSGEPFRSSRVDPAAIRSLYR